MASTYISKFIIPGRRAGNIKQIINDVGYTKITQTVTANPVQPFTITSGNPTIDYNNNYYTITFLDNGSIKFLLPLTNAENDFNVLVVGGGGGGNASDNTFTNGGGGGAGGEVVYTSVYNIYQNINYNIVVGQGGAPNNNGDFSSFSTIVAYGGSMGTSATNIVGGSGGIGINGGGSGGNGGTSVRTMSIHAMDGYNGTLVTINSISNYYGGGGGGGSYDGQPSSALGGLGGGGGGGFNSNIGTPNTGGGGGGGNGDGNSLRVGGPGGSGIVILYFKYIHTVIDTINSFSKPCICPSPINSKIIKNSNPDVIPASTQTARAVNAIKYARGGRVVFGNAAYNSNGDTLLGRINGGYEPPIKNKF